MKGSRQVAGVIHKAVIVEVIVNGAIGIVEHVNGKLPVGKKLAAVFHFQVFRVGGKPAFAHSFLQPGEGPDCGRRLKIKIALVIKYFCAKSPQVGHDVRVALVVFGKYGKRINAVRQLCRQSVEDVLPLGNGPVANLAPLAGILVQAALPEQLFVVDKDVLHPQIGHEVNLAVAHAGFPYFFINIPPQFRADDIIKRHDTACINVAGEIEKCAKKNIRRGFGIETAGYGLDFIHIIESFYVRFNQRPRILGGKIVCGPRKKSRAVMNGRIAYGVHFLYWSRDDQAHCFSFFFQAPGNANKKRDNKRGENFEKIVFHLPSPSVSCAILETRMNRLGHFLQ